MGVGEGGVGVGEGGVGVGVGVEEKTRRIRESSVKEVYVMLFLISLTFSDKLL